MLYRLRNYEEDHKMHDYVSVTVPISKILMKNVDTKYFNRKYQISIDFSLSGIKVKNHVIQAKKL